MKSVCGFRYNFIRKVIYLYIIIIIYIRQREEEGEKQKLRTQIGPLSSDDWSSAISPSSTPVLDYNRHAIKHLGPELSSTKLGRWWGYFPRGGETEERQSMTLYSFTVGPAETSQKKRNTEANASIQGPQTPAPDFADRAHAIKPCPDFV